MPTCSARWVLPFLILGAFACSGEVAGGGTGAPAGASELNPTGGVTDDGSMILEDAEGNLVVMDDMGNLVPVTAGGTGTGTATTATTGDGTTTAMDTGATTSTTTTSVGNAATEPVEVPDTLTGVTPMPLDGTPIYSRFARLTHEQWENTVRDLLRLDAVPGMSSAFSADTPDGAFANNERRLFVTSVLWGDYQIAAENLSVQVAQDPAALGKIRGSGDSAAFIASLGERAYRRPLTAAEQQSYQELFDSAKGILGGSDAFADGAQLVIEAMLQSPNFLYRVEETADGQPLSGYELATKISYLLRNTMPDDALFEAARQGPEQVLAMVPTLVDAEAARNVVHEYHAAWMGTERYESILKANDLFPDYDESLNGYFEDEMNRFFEGVFASNGGLRELFTSTTGYVNQATAPYYGVTATGMQLSQMELPAERAGFLTRLGFLAYNGTLRNSDPIRRGVDIVRHILCRNLVPPEGTIPPLPDFEPGQTNRQRVALHTEAQGSVCVGCHGTQINPLGFAFENFDAIGQWRDLDNGQPVDASGSYVFRDFAESPRSFDGGAALNTILAESTEAHGCYTKNLMEYALTRDVAESDAALAATLQAQSVANGISIKEMLTLVVEHPSFSTRPSATIYQGASQ